NSGFLELAVGLECDVAAVGRPDQARGCDSFGRFQPSGLKALEIPHPHDSLPVVGSNRSKGEMLSIWRQERLADNLIGRRRKLECERVWLRRRLFGEVQGRKCYSRYSGKRG